MGKRKKLNTFTHLPNFLSVDREGACVIFELGCVDEHMSYVDVMHKAVKKVRYDGTDAIVEEAIGSNSESIFISMREGSFLPETYNSEELCWYEKFTEDGEELTIEELLTLCVV